MYNSLIFRFTNADRIEVLPFIIILLMGMQNNGDLK